MQDQDVMEGIGALGRVGVGPAFQDVNPPNATEGPVTFSTGYGAPSQRFFGRDGAPGAAILPFTGTFTVALPRGGEAHLYPDPEGGFEVYSWSRNLDSGYCIGFFPTHADAMHAVQDYRRAIWGEVVA